MELYTAVYNYCTSGDISPPPIQKREGYNQRYGDALLRVYVKEWDRYITGAKYLSRVCNLVDRQWVKVENKETAQAKKLDARGFHTIYNLALVQWKLHGLPSAQGQTHRLTSAFLQQLEDGRRDGVVDFGLLKQVTTSLLAVGMDDQPIISNSGEVVHGNLLAVYTQHIESPFIAACKQLYALELEGFTRTGNLSGYLRHLEARVREEEDRIDRCMYVATKNTLIEDFVYDGHARTVWYSFQNLLNFDEDEDLRRMYNLLQHKAGGLQALQEKFEEHVKQSGLDSVERFSDRQGGMHADAFVRAILDVHTRNSGLVEKCFQDDIEFTTRLDKACQYFVNENAAATTSSKIPPQLLAQHADALLRKGGLLTGSREFDQALDGVMTVLRYINDKDVFQTFYTNSLCRRLLHGSSTSEEVEASMIAKLREACSLDYSSKLMRMVTEVAVSKELTDDFRRSMGQHSGNESLIDFSIVVMGMNMWPLTVHPSGFEIPKEILWTYERFSRFYGQRHQGRKLNWLWGQSKNELRTNFLNKPYILNCSSYQMVVLVHYNDSETLSFDELFEATNIHKDILIQVVHGLVKGKLLIQETDERFSINLDPSFASKTMPSQILIKEVKEQLSGRFTPRQTDLDSAMAVLIEKEYIDSATVDGQDMLVYLA
ncbi:hypothetical protein FRB97_003655 [Tulasnella sp. 331]|nr:hypothetical protein FRB97_003655 [Tulasnella sp. 331]